MAVCCVCLTNNEQTFIDISEDHLSIISKHFWFDPCKEPYESDFICCECWEIINRFHQLYISVEKSHRDFKNLIIKEDVKNENQDNLNLIKEEEECYEDDENITNQPIDTFVDDDDQQDYEELSNENNVDLPLRQSKSIIKNKRKKPTKNKSIKTVDKKSAKNKGSELLRSERARLSDEYDKKVSSFMKLTCDICSAELPTFGKLKTHFRNEHKDNQNGYAVCCKRKYYKRNLLIDHIDTHFNPDHFKCPTCGKTFTNKESHQTHLKTFHLPDRVIYECDECPKKFSWRYVLLAHKKTHAPKEEWTYKCKECDKTFASHTFLSSHMHYVHRVTKKICDLCGKSVSNTSFRKHQMKHSNIIQPKVQCDICGSWLNKKYIKIHLKNHEESGTDHICIHCGKKSPNSKALYKHIYEVHTLRKTLKCTVCEKIFKSKDLLAQHMPVHTGENNFTCPYCPRTFKFKSNSHDHRKKEHPIEFEEERKKRLSKKFIKEFGGDNDLGGKETTAVDNLKIEENINDFYN